MYFWMSGDFTVLGKIPKVGTRAHTLLVQQSVYDTNNVG
jgi:hypothetical protein